MNENEAFTSTVTSTREKKIDPLNVIVFLPGLNHYLIYHDTKLVKKFNHPMLKGARTLFCNLTISYVNKSGSFF